MVFFAPLVGAATLFAGLAAAAPRPDSASGPEVAVSAPNGVILSDTAALSSAYATATASASSAYYSAAVTASAYDSSYTSSYDSSYASSYDSSYDSSSSYYASASSSALYSLSTDSSNYYTTSSSAYGSLSTYAYGSGSNSWGSSGYNDCVNQCVASFGAPPPTYTPPPTSSSSYSGSGSGTVHTIIVAPTPGTLRYMPPFVNAQPGDTIHWVWRANNHTVTKSSALQICNKTSDAPFASGEQNTGFTFDQPVNDTNPTFFYCGTPTHCEKGMFGTLNPAGMSSSSVSMGNSSNSTMTVDQMMGSMVSNSSTLSAMMSYLNSMNGSSAAMSWGGNVSMSNFPEWSYESVMENVIYARTLFAMNPDTISSTGVVDMSAGGNPIKFPQDLASVMNTPVNNAASTDSSSSTSSGAPSSTPASATSSGSSSSSSTSTSPSTTPSNGAGHVVASSALLGVAAIAASLLAL